MADDIDKIRIIVEPDTTGFQQELDSKLSKVKGEVPLAADTTEFDKDVASAKKRAEADDVEVDVDANTTGAAVKIKAFKTNAEKDDIEIDVDVNTKGASAHLKAFFAKTGKQADGASKKLQGNLNASANELQNLGQLVVPPAVVSGLLSLAGAASSLAVGAVAAVAPVVQLGAGLASLPAIIGAAVVATKTIGFAFQGVGDALGGLNEEIDKEKFAALTPEAQKMVKTLDAMKAPLIEVQRTIQANLFPAIDGAIDRFKLFGPAATSAADAVSTAIADIVTRGSALLTSPLYSGIIRKQLELLAPIITMMGGSLINLSLALLSVVDAARPFTTWLVAGFERWTASVAKAAASGDGMTKFFMDLRLTAGIVFRLFRNLGDLMGTIFSGATPMGRELLLILNGVVARTNAFLESPKGQTALADYFEAAQPTILEIARLVRDVGKAFLQLATDPSVTKIIKQIRTELVPAFGDLLVEANKNMPALVSALTSLTHLFEMLSPAMGVAAEAIESVARPIANFLDAHPKVRGFVTTMLGFATATALVLAPIKLLSGLFKPLFTLIKPLVPMVKNLVMTFIRGFVPVMMRIGSVLATVGRAFMTFGKWFLKIGKAIRPVLMLLARVGRIVGSLGTILRVAVIAIGAIVAAIGAIPAAIIAAIAIVGILIWKVDFIREGLISAGKAIWDFFKALPGYIMQGVQLIGTALSGLGALFSRAWNAALAAVKQAVTAIVAFVRLIPARLIMALTKLGIMLANFFRRVWATAVNVVKTIVAGYITFVAGIPGRILAALISLGQILWNIANNAWTRFKNIMVAIVTNVITFVQGIPGRISGALGDLSQTLYGKGKEVIEGLLKGFKDAWKDVKKWLQDRANIIKSLKGPIEVDRTLLVDEGKAIMGGFHEGLKDKWESVADFLGSRGGFIKGLLTGDGVREAMDLVSKLFTGEVSFSDVSEKLDGLVNYGLHPTSGLADTTAMASVIARMFGLGISSIQRSYDTVAGPGVSQHTLGEAADFTGMAAALDRAAKTLSRMVGRVFSQIIWRNQEWRGGYIDMSSFVPDHMDHLHAGWRRRAIGGRVESGHGYVVGEAGPEPFFPDQSGYIMNNYRFSKLLTMGDRVRNLESMVSPRGQEREGTMSAGTMQDIDFNIEVNHGVNDASSLMAILTTRLDAFARASMPSIAGGIS